MPHFRIRRENRGCRVHDGHKGWLVHRADSVGLSRSSMGAVASTVSRHYVGERIVEAFGFCVYAISERQPEHRGIHEDAFDSSERDVKNIVYRSASVGI